MDSYAECAKKAVQQGRSELRGESYSAPYGEPLSETRTPLAVFFRILLKEKGHLAMALPSASSIVNGSSYFGYDFGGATCCHPSPLSDLSMATKSCCSSSVISKGIIVLS